MEAQSESVYLNTAVWFAKHTGRMAPGPPSNCIDVQPARNDTAELNFYALRKTKKPTSTRAPRTPTQKPSPMGAAKNRYERSTPGVDCAQPVCQACECSWSRS